MGKVCVTNEIHFCLLMSLCILWISPSCHVTVILKVILCYFKIHFSHTSNSTNTAKAFLQECFISSVHDCSKYTGKKDKDYVLLSDLN